MTTEIISKYFPQLPQNTAEKLASLKSLYADWNEKINVISRKDMDHFYERHVLHSLAIAHYVHFQTQHAICKTIGFAFGKRFGQPERHGTRHAPNTVATHHFECGYAFNSNTSCPRL